MRRLLLIVLAALALATPASAAFDGGHGTAGLPPCNSSTYYMVAYNSAGQKHRCIPSGGGLGFWAPIP